MDQRRRDGLKRLAGLGLAAALPPARTSAAEPLRLAYFETYRPLSFVEKDGTLRGILVEVQDAVLARQLGLTCRHEGLPWPRAQSLVERGERDAICTVATPERLGYAVAAEEVVVTAPTCIFVRADNPRLPSLAQARSLAELQTLRPAVLSYSGNGWARTRLTDFNVTWGGDFNSALKMLLARRGDIMIENALTMQHSLARLEGGAAVRMLPHRMDQANFQLLLSKQSPHLAVLPEFSRALARFKATPAYAEIFRSYGLEAYF